MKSLFFLLATLAFANTVRSQINNHDTNYATRAVSAVWMPDGKSILIAVVKYHKTNNQAPYFSKVFNYNIGTKQLVSLFDNGGNLAPSPDGKTIAFLKRDQNKRVDIYAFDLKTKREYVLYTDSSGKNSLKWSPDGKNLVYNISSKGVGQQSTIDICVLNIATKRVKQITRLDKDKAYDPNWSPDGKGIVYYLEKGDGRDQIWLTDRDGSFHTNLTNDTTTHNYFPSWFGEKTILYTQDPGGLMMIDIDGRNRRKFEAFNADQAGFNPRTGQFVYIVNEEGNKVIVYDWKKKSGSIVADGTKLIGIF